MTHLNTTSQQIPVTFPQLAVHLKLTNEVIKELILDPSYSSDTIQDYLEDNIPLNNSTEIKNGVDFCQVDNPEQKQMKTSTGTKDPDRFNPQQDTDNNKNIKYEKGNGETFTRSYRMNLLRNAEFIAIKNWNKVP